MDGHFQARQSATILAFPGSRAKFFERRMAAALEADTLPTNVVDTDSWYHQAAMAEEPKHNA